MSSIKKTFIEQPYGTHKNPDFIVRLDSGYLLNIEVSLPMKFISMYNSGNVLLIICMFSVQKI